MEQLKSHSKAGRHTKYVSFISVCFVPIVLPLLRRCPPLFNFNSPVIHATWFVRMLQFSILASMLCNPLRPQARRRWDAIGSGDENSPVPGPQLVFR